MFRKSLIASILSLTMVTAAAETMFTIANTFEDPEVIGEKEISTMSFDVAVYSNQAVRVGEGVDITSLVNFYDIDVSADMSGMTMTLSNTAKPFNNPLSNSRFDRYYTFAGATRTDERRC